MVEELIQTRRANKRSRLTAQQKADYLHLIHKDFLAGLHITEIALKHKISTASIYRWQRESSANAKRLDIKTNFRNINISDVVETLTLGSNGNIIEKRDALFKFIIWLRWPSEPHNYSSALLNCTASYLKQRWKTNFINEIGEPEKEFLYKYLTLDSVERLSSPYAELNPDFEIVSNAKNRYDDRQFYAQIINYLLYDKNKLGRAHRPKLSELHDLVELGAIGREWAMSSRTLDKYWRLRAASFPFIYVEHYHSSFNWSLNPQDADFAEQVDECLRDHGDLRSYFSKVKWVVHRLRSTLNSRALSRISYPSFPRCLKAIPVKNPELDTKLKEKIAELNPTVKRLS